MYPHPCWQGGMSIETGFRFLSSKGVNAIRVPISADLITHLDDPQTSTFVNFLNIAYNYNMLVMIDLHVFAAATELIGNWHISNATYEYQPDYPLYRVKDLWVKLATFLKAYPNVFGADIKNEPHNASWSDWRGAASEIGKAILSANPNLFIVVEGVDTGAGYIGEASGWGGALEGARNEPIDVGVPGKVIYSPHRYGKGIGDGSATAIQNTSESGWNYYFGYLRDRSECVMMGEWGLGKRDDIAWNQSLAEYMARKGIDGFYWAFSHTSADTTNILRESTSDSNVDFHQESLDVMSIACPNPTKLTFPTR